jgi:predicted enzyme related to lactoylglutathione lyase
MTTLAMTKLIVADLERAKAFYEAVCGVTEAQRIKGMVDGRPITELIMAAAAPGGATLVLLQYQGAPAPPAGACMLVFDTNDVEAFVARATSAGGSVMQAATHLPDFALTYALVRDPEGHILEPLARHMS